MANGDEAILMPRAGGLVRREFGSTAIEARAETASIVLAEQAKARVQAAYIMAMQRPRDMDDVRLRVLQECRRPGFAAKAIYSKPIGGGRVSGPSIRLAETCIQKMGNVLVETPTIYDDPERRIVRCIVTDMETNASFASDLTIEKTVERSSASGRMVIAQRKNSGGKDVFVVQATEDELSVKQAAMLSKAIRTNGLRLVPADVLEEAMAACRATQENDAAKDPNAARKSLADAFATLSIMPSDLKLYLGHELAQCSPAELADLRATFASIRDGETTWREVLEASQQEAARKGESPLPSTEPPKAPSATAAPKNDIVDATLHREPGSDDGDELDPMEKEANAIVAGAEADDVTRDTLDGLIKRATALGLPAGDPLRAKVEAAFKAAQKRIKARG